MYYEQKYKEALERAKKIKHDVENVGCAMDADMLDIIFPELAESEDESIRKEIVRFIKESPDMGALTTKRYERWLAWLEKQKPIDNTIKGGDIVIDKYGRVFLVLANVSERNYKEEYSTYCESLLLGVDGCVYSNGTDLEGYKNANEEDRAKFLHDLKVTTRISNKPAEWGEEDARCLRFIRHNIEYLKREDRAYRSYEDQSELQKELDFIERLLKGLVCQQPHWKPSEEQMEALRRAFNTGSIEFSDMEKLATLYEDIKIEIL